MILVAGVLIVEEAGGRISTVDGTAFSVFDRSLLATNDAVYDKVQPVLEEGHRKLQASQMGLYLSLKCCSVSVFICWPDRPASARGRAPQAASEITRLNSGLFHFRVVVCVACLPVLHDQTAALSSQPCQVTRMLIALVCCRARPQKNSVDLSPWHIPHGYNVKAGRH